MAEYSTVPYANLLPPETPIRVAMDDERLRELAESIRADGLIHPLAVFPKGDKWEVGAGHRRYVALGILGWTDVPVFKYPDEEALKLAIRLDENTMREEVTAAEEGQLFLELVNKHGWSLEDVMRRLHRSENYINEHATLVADYPDVAEHVFSRAMTWPQAKAIMRMKNPARRSYLIDQAIHAGATARNLSVMIGQFRVQDQIAAGAGQSGAPEQSYIAAEIPIPRCVWCARDDDQGNMALIPVHSYHRRDLELWLDRVGNSPVAAEVGNAR
jgi:ParB family chromosome partitioning protein